VSRVVDSTYRILRVRLLNRNFLADPLLAGFDRAATRRSTSGIKSEERRQHMAMFADHD